MTADGQGAGYRPGKHSISLPISDRIGKKGTGVEQGQTAFAISKKSGAKSCFVATACYGAADESTVVALRRYREVVLKKRPLDAPLYIGTTS